MQRISLRKGEKYKERKNKRLDIWGHKLRRKLKEDHSHRTYNLKGRENIWYLSSLYLLSKLLEYYIVQ